MVTGDECGHEDLLIAGRNVVRIGRVPAAAIVRAGARSPTHSTPLP